MENIKNCAEIINVQMNFIYGIEFLILRNKAFKIFKISQSVAAF